MYPLWRMLSRARMTLRLSGLQKHGMGRDKATGQGQNSVHLVNNPGRAIIGWCRMVYAPHNNDVVHVRLYTTKPTIYYKTGRVRRRRVHFQMIHGLHNDILLRNAPAVCQEYQVTVAYPGMIGREQLET